SQLTFNIKSGHLFELMNNTQKEMPIFKGVRDSTRSQQCNHGERVKGVPMKCKRSEERVRVVVRKGIAAKKQEDAKDEIVVADHMCTEEDLVPQLEAIKQEGLHFCGAHGLEKREEKECAVEDCAEVKTPIGREEECVGKGVHDNDDTLRKEEEKGVEVTVEVIEEERILKRVAVLRIEESTKENRKIYVYLKEEHGEEHTNNGECDSEEEV
ncbi:hypothetical protein KI387_029914, partial [Taxus chinensis]